METIWKGWGREVTSQQVYLDLLTTQFETTPLLMAYPNSAPNLFRKNELERIDGTFRYVVYNSVIDFENARKKSRFTTCISHEVLLPSQFRKLAFRLHFNETQLLLHFPAHWSELDGVFDVLTGHLRLAFPDVDFRCAIAHADKEMYFQFVSDVPWRPSAGLPPYFNALDQGPVPILGTTVIDGPLRALAGFENGSPVFKDADWMEYRWCEPAHWDPPPFDPIPGYCPHNTGGLHIVGDNRLYICRKSALDCTTVQLIDIDSGKVTGEGWQSEVYDVGASTPLCSSLCIGQAPLPLFRIERDVHLLDVNGKHPPFEEILARATDKTVIALCGDMNTGKSFCLGTYLKKHPEQRWIWVSPRDSLSYATYESTHTPGGSYYSSINPKSSETIDWTNDNIVCTTQSLFKVSGRVDFLIIDEARDCFETANGLDTPIGKGQALNEIKRLMRLAKCVVFADAFGDETLALMAKHAKMPILFFDLPSAHPFQGCECTFFYPYHEDMMRLCTDWYITHILDRVAAGDTLHIVVSTKEIMNQVYMALDKKAYRIYGGQSVEDRQIAMDAFTSCDHEHRVWISTPALTGGANNFSVNRVITLVDTISMSCATMKNAGHRARNAKHWDYIIMKHAVVNRRALQLEKTRVSGLSSPDDDTSLRELREYSLRLRTSTLEDHPRPQGYVYGEKGIRHRLIAAAPRATVPRLPRDDKLKYDIVLAGDCDLDPSSVVVEKVRKRKLDQFGSTGGLVQEMNSMIELETTNRDYDMYDFLLAAAVNQKMNVRHKFIVIDATEGKRLKRVLDDVKRKVKCMTALRYKNILEHPPIPWTDESVIGYMLSGKNAHGQDVIDLYLAQLSFSAHNLTAAIDAVFSSEDQDKAISILSKMMNQRIQTRFRVLAAYDRFFREEPDHYMTRIHTYNKDLKNHEPVTFKIATAMELLEAFGFKGGLFCQDEVEGLYPNAETSKFLDRARRGRKQEEISRRDTVFRIFTRDTGKTLVEKPDPRDPRQLPRDQYAVHIKSMLQNCFREISCNLSDAESEFKAADEVIDSNNDSRKVRWRLKQSPLIAMLGEHTTTIDLRTREFWRKYSNAKYGTNDELIGEGWV